MSPRDKDVRQVFQRTSTHVINTYLYGALCTIAALAKKKVLASHLSVFFELWKITSLHAALEILRSFAV